MAVFSTVDLVQLDRQPLCSLFLASPYLSLASGLGCAVRWCWARSLGLVWWACTYKELPTGVKR